MCAKRNDNNRKTKFEIRTKIMLFSYIYVDFLSAISSLLFQFNANVTHSFIYLVGKLMLLRLLQLLPLCIRFNGTYYYFLI